MKTIKNILFISFVLLSFVGQSQEKQGALTEKICGAGYINWSSTDSIGNFEAALLRHLGYPKDHPDKEKIITKFFNENNALLICGDDNDTYIRENEHILKRSLALGEWDFLGYVANNPKYDGFDWNFYEIVDGKKETILDYLDMIINDEELASEYDVDELKTLIGVLEESGAKRGRELE